LKKVISSSQRPAQPERAEPQNPAELRKKIEPLLQFKLPLRSAEELPLRREPQKKSKQVLRFKYSSKQLFRFKSSSEQFFRIKNSSAIRHRFSPIEC
jgi:hypothetical protein